MAVQMRGGILRNQAGECAHACKRARSKAGGHGAVLPRNERRARGTDRESRAFR